MENTRQCKALLGIGDSLVCNTDKLNNFRKHKKYQVLNVIEDKGSLKYVLQDDYHTSTFPVSALAHNFLFPSVYPDADSYETKTVAELSEKVNHPYHYTWLKDKCGIEVIDIVRHLDFDTGNAVKYLLRCGHKSEEGMSDKEKAIEDLKKAVWYIGDKIKTLQGNDKDSVF